MKIVQTGAAMAVAMSATSAIAGSVAPVAVVEPMLIEEAPMGSGSGAWIIPLLLLGAVVLLTRDSGDSSDSGDSGDNEVPPPPPLITPR